jgi:hypothetical protein
MGSNRWSSRRIAGLAGIVFVVLLVVTFIVGGRSPAYDDSAAKFREFFVEDDTSVHLTSWLAALAFVFFFLPFASGLRNLLASADKADEQMWSRLSYTGAVLAVAIGGVGSSFWEVLSQGTAEELSDDTLVALARFDTVIFASVLPWALALFLAGSSVVILRSGVLARWIGWLGTAGALMLVTGTLWVFTEDDENALVVLIYIGLPVTLLWVLVVGITMFVSDRPATDPAA